MHYFELIQTSVLLVLITNALAHGDVEGFLREKVLSKNRKNESKERE